MNPERTKRLAVLAIVLFLATLCWASITGSISGVVADSSGAVVPGATVVATNTQTGVKASVVSDGKGFYSFPSLPAGIRLLPQRPRRSILLSITVLLTLISRY